MTQLPVRILHVLGKRPVGGVGAYLLNMHQYINKSKVQFDYLISSALPDGDFDRNVKALGANVYLMPELKCRNGLKYTAHLRRFFKENAWKYHAVEVHSTNVAVFSFYFARKYNIKNRISHGHSTKYADSWLKSVRNFILQLPLKRMANHYVACGINVANFLYGTAAVRNNKVTIVRNSIDLDKFRYDAKVRAQLRQELDIQDNFVLGHVGNFVPTKNHDFLIDVFRDLYTRLPETRLILVGTGELEGNTKTKVRELNLEHAVRFLGRRNDVNRLMQAFDVFLLPSQFEGVPLVGIEAQAAGLPCFFSDTVTTELKLTDDAVYNRTQSPAEWASEIIKVVGNHNERNNSIAPLVDSGYEIHQASENLCRYYLSLN